MGLVIEFGKTGILNSNPSVALEVGSSSSIQQVKVNGNIVLGSDARMKENISEISNSLAQLKKLKGVSYNLKEQKKELVFPEKVLKNSGLSLQELKEQFENALPTSSDLLKRNLYGFVAQDVQKLFPNLVYEDDSTGMLSVDYIGIIPLLVNGLQEQQGQIEKLQTQLEDQQEHINQLIALISAEPIQKSIANSETQAQLLQNVPNPFNVQTEIGYYLPATVQRANLYVYDLNGIQQRQFSITERGNGSVVLQASSLTAGIYFYTLICDGKPVDTRQMILTK